MARGRELVVPPLVVSRAIVEIFLTCSTNFIEIFCK